MWLVALLIAASGGRWSRDARASGTINPELSRADVTAIMFALQGVIDNAGDRRNKPVHG